MLQYKFNSKAGDLFLVASETHLLGIFWSADQIKDVKTIHSLKQTVAEESKARRILQQTKDQLQQYFDKSRQDFSLPLKIEGTVFQKKVWNALCEIPYGETVSYKDVAKRIGKEKAVRAVGTANGRNAFSIVIPCHRVIAADSSIGGYAGGLNAKEILLRLEKQSKLD